MNTSVRIFNSNKIIVFTKQKVASRFLEEVMYFGKTNNSSYTISENLKLDSSTTEIGIGDNIISYNDIFNIKKNKKEIILLYRNPMNRFITGLLQHTLVNKLTDGTGANLSLIIDDIYKYKTPLDILSYKVNEYLFGIPDKSHPLNSAINLDTDIVKKETEELSIFILNRLCSVIDIHPIFYDAHTENFLARWNDIITSKTVDLSKVTLINIDDTRNNLEDIFKSIEPELNYKNSNIKRDTSNGRAHAKKILEKIIKENPRLNKKIKSFIEIDSYFYTKFEKSNLNILNKK